MVGGFCRKGLPGFDDPRKLLAWEESDHNVNVVGHDAPRKKPVMPSLAKTKGCSHGASDAHIEERARASATVEVLFDVRVAIVGVQSFLFGKKTSAVIFGRIQNAMAFGDFDKNVMGE